MDTHDNTEIPHSIEEDKNENTSTEQDQIRRMEQEKQMEEEEEKEEDQQKKEEEEVSEQVVTFVSQVSVGV